MALSRYNRLPIAQKRAEAIARAREPAVTCPSCDTQVMPADLLKHMDERCEGLREPNGAAKWIVWSEVMTFGVPSKTVQYWVHTGRVRYRGERLDRQYLLRDLVLIIAIRRLRQRRNGEISPSDGQEMEGPE
jgi:hypothetical protein